MKFQLIDTVVTREPERIVALKQVTMAEEYLADHFPTFPVLPGVLMLEAMVQAARDMLGDRGDKRLVLGEVRAMKYGTFVRPGDTLYVDVSLHRASDDGSYACRGTATVRRAEAGGAGEGGGSGDRETAVSGRFTMRSIRSDAENAPAN